MKSTAPVTSRSVFLACDMMYIDMALFPEKPILTQSQIERLSNIFDNAGQVALGASVVSPLFTGFDRIDISSILIGVVLVSFCWTLSLWLAKRKDVEI